MKPRRLLVGCTLRELLLWSGFVAFGVGVFLIPIASSQSHLTEQRSADGRSLSSNSTLPSCWYDSSDQSNGFWFDETRLGSGSFLATRTSRLALEARSNGLATTLVQLERPSFASLLDLGIRLQI